MILRRTSKTYILFSASLSLPQDEINQGLDDRNERLVFKRIVKNSTRRPSGGDPTNHSGQYFLITPKLLPNLYDMEEEAMTVLIVFNGTKNFESPTEWNVDHMIECA
jgi:structural maintenance of chromosomes protein 5